MSSQTPRSTGRKYPLLGVLTVPLAAVAIISVLVLTLIPLRREAQLARQRQIQQMETVANTQAQSIQQWLTDLSEQLGAFASNPETVDVTASLLDTTEAGPGAAVYAANRSQFTILARPLEASFDRVMLIDADGTVRASTTSTMLNRDVSLEPWFAETQEAAPGVLLTTGPLRDPQDEQESLFFTLHLVDNTGQTAGMIAARTGMEGLLEIMANTPLSSDTSDYYLVRQGKQYVTPPRLAPETVVADGEIVSTALSGEVGSGTWTDYRGEQVDGAYRWLDGLDMAVIVKQDVSETLTISRALARSQIIAAVVMGALGFLVIVAVARWVSVSLGQVNQVADEITEGDLEQRVPPTSFAEVNTLGESLNQMAGRLKALTDQQEAIIQARTRELEVTARLGHAIASFTELEELLQNTVHMISEQLGYYHVQVFLLDDLRQNAVLRASMGEAGREMLARNHKLAVGSRSVVGQATQRVEPVLASDTRHAEYWYPNPLLPETRAELAIPLRIGDQVMGALDLQSAQPETFDEATISVLQTVADQLAVAIRNADLFEEKEGLLSASLELTQMLTADSWQEYATNREKGDLAYQYDLSEVKPLQGEPGQNGGDGNLQLPIALRGAVIGELSAQLSEGQHLSEEEQQLVNQVLDRVALAIDNARLVEQTQMSLQETNRLYQATQAIAAVNAIEDLANVLLDLAADGTADHAALLLVDTPDVAVEDAFVKTQGIWTRQQDDRFTMEAGRRFAVREHPLLQTEDGVRDQVLVVNNAEQSELSASVLEYVRHWEVRALALFPLITGGALQGWLLLQGKSGRRGFSADDQRFFQTVADQAATALQGIFLFEQTQARARRLQATNEVSRAASSILNPDVLMPMIVDRISEAFEYYHTQIFLIDENGQWANLSASTGEVGEMLLERGHRLAVGSRSVIGQVTESGEVVIARDTDTDAVHRRNELLPNTRAEMALPLKTGDRVIGALDVQSTEPGAFDEEAKAILQSLTDQIAVTLENAQLFQEIQDRVAELTTVNLVSQTVSRAQTLDELYDVVADQLQRQFDARHAVLGVVDDDDMLHLPIFIEEGELVDPPPPPQPVGAGISGHVIRNKEVLLLNENTEEEARRLGARVVGVMPRSMLLVPMMIADEVIGILSIQDAEREHAYNEAHVRQLTTLAAYIAVKIRNAQLLEEAQRRADELGFLFDVTRAAVQTSDLDEALSNVADILLREVPNAESAVVYLTQQQQHEEVFEAYAAVGYGREQVARREVVGYGEGLVGRAVERRKPLLIGDAQARPYNIHADSRTHSALVVPLMSREETVGVLTVESAQVNVFTENDLQLLEAASGTLMAVIQNARLLEQITRANEQLREVDKLKSQFLANMSHELRTPLNSIIGFSRVMLKGIDGPLNDLQEQDLTTIYNSGQHLLGLINNILDLSKIEAGKMEIQPEYTSLEELFDSVISTGRGLVKDKPIELYKELNNNIPDVYGDPVRIRQVLLNLMSNAAKFTKEGSITVRATRLPAEPKAGKPPRVQIDVEDTGIGIASEDMDMLFEAFSQVDGSTTRQVGGTGLGLTITKEFIELMGGEVWVESEVDEGTIFSFTVPMHPPGTEAAQVVIQSEHSGDRPLVLAVDDEPGVLDLYARYLEKEGYAVVGLNNAIDLLDYVREYQPSAIVMDLNLPGKTGWDAINDLKSHEDTENIPVVICSIDDARERGQSIGVAEYLVKPVIEDDLLNAMSRVMEGPISGLRSVVIIDADTDYAQATATMLEETFGAEVKIFGQGVEGLAALQEYEPDVVMLDLDLPDMDGYGLLVSMRSQGGLKDVPVIIYTERELSDEEMDHFDEQMTHYVPKATDERQLIDDLTAVLEAAGK